MNLTHVTIPNEPWDNWVKRIIIHVPDYLSYDGEPVSGGRQRNVRDISLIIRDMWGRKPLIVQRAKKHFETTDSNGIPVVGVKVSMDMPSGPIFGKKTSQLIHTGDAILYMGPEDAWPFFVKNAKAFHVGIWWDGPFSWYTRALTAHRTMSMMTACRSVLCVDTNVINWVRCRGKQGLNLVNKCQYIPNCTDLNSLDEPIRRHAPNVPLRIIFSRRPEKKRGGELFLNSLVILKDRGFPFEATVSLAAGHFGVEHVYDYVNARSLGNHVHIVTNNMDSVMKEYNNKDVAIIPTIWSEGTSYSCIEAIAAGIPVVTTPVGGLGNLVIPGYNGLIIPPVASILADAIIQAAQPDHWRVMHEACIAMRQTFSYEVWKYRLLHWLRS